MSAITHSLNKLQLGSRQQLPQLRSAGRRALVCRAEAGNNTGAAKVKFNVTQHVEFGQQVEVTGEAETLGLWEQSVPLTWTEGDVWTGECELAPGAVEYKYVIKTVDGALVGWQPGENKVIKVDEPGVEVTVNDGWDMPEAMTEAMAEASSATEAMMTEAVAGAAAAAAAATSAGTSPFPSVDKSEAVEAADIIEKVIEVAEDIVEEVVEEIEEMEK